MRSPAQRVQLNSQTPRQISPVLLFAVAALVLLAFFASSISPALSVTLSVGISIYPEGGLSAQELLRNADAAMYSVKDSGRNSLRIFSESLAPTRRTLA